MPRSTSVQTSSSIIPSSLPAPHPANHRFFTPLFSFTSEPLFSQLLSFHIYLRCPLAFSPHASIQRIWPISSLRSLRLCGKSRRFLRLAPLVLSCLSFFLRPRLFSAACGLFLQNTGGGVCCVRIPGAPMPIRNFMFWISPKRG